MPPSHDDVVRVRLRYPDVETFVEKFAPNVTRGGIFLASREPRPVGDVVRFEVHIRQGGALLTGEGRVTWVKEFNPAEPHRPYGMGVQFIYVDPACRPTLDRLLKQKDQARAPAPPPGSQPRMRIPDEGRSTERVPVVEELEGTDLDETGFRRTLDRARHLSSRTDDLEALLAPEPESPVTVAEALSDLPRLLAGRRPTGTFRILGEEPTEVEKKD